jgi:xanthine dehydrogenase accessory factor
MKSILQRAGEELASGRAVVLARIIHQVGSAPRSLGTSCLIHEDGSIEGTIGGGRLEFEVIQAAGDALRDGRSRILNFRLTGKEAAEGMMLCGGIVDVYVEPLNPSHEETMGFFDSVARLTSEQSHAVLVTAVRDGTPWDKGGTRALFNPDGTLLQGRIDGLHLSDEFIKELKSSASMNRPLLLRWEEEDRSLFIQPVAPQELLLVFGAGHISTYVVPLAKMVGFRVVVVDDREEFANRERFPAADEILCVPFGEAFQRMDEPHGAYIVIVTRGHMSDREVLRDALKLDAAYIGMIGSRRKRDLVYKRLQEEEGVSVELLKKVHSPIGLNIGAETPEEIAVSIVAELIMERARKRGTSVP